ncbi:unnamed protein product, partial [Protopolystoma xenopodis]
MTNLTNATKFDREAGEVTHSRRKTIFHLLSSISPSRSPPHMAFSGAFFSRSLAEPPPECSGNETSSSSSSVITEVLFTGPSPASVYPSNSLPVGSLPTSEASSGLGFALLDEYSTGRLPIASSNSPPALVDMVATAPTTPITRAVPRFQHSPRKSDPYTRSFPRPSCYSDGSSLGRQLPGSMVCGLAPRLLLPPTVAASGGRVITSSSPTTYLGLSNDQTGDQLQEHELEFP